MCLNPISTFAGRLVADSSQSTGIKWAAPAGGGKVLQVVSTAKTDTFTLSSNTYTDITGLSASITPSATTSKILVIAHITMGTGIDHGNFLRLMRGSTPICISDASGNITQATWGAALFDANIWYAGPVNFLDSPSTTSSTTYKFQIRTSGTGQTAYINRSKIDSDSNQACRGTSVITLLEIGA